MKETFEVIGRDYIDRKEVGGCHRSTIATYRFFLERHLIPYFMDMAPEDIIEDEIQEFIKYLQDEGNLKQDGGLKPKSIREIYRLLKSILDDYRWQHKLYGLNEKAIHLPPKEEDEVEIFTKEEIGKLLTKAQSINTEKSLAIIVALFTGMRIGELCALRGSDINLSSKTITVSKTVQRIYYVHSNKEKKTEVVIGPPKSKSSLREIPISFFLESILRRYNNIGSETFLLTGTEKAMEPAALRNYYESFLEKLDIPHHRFHALRHTFATKFLSTPVNDKKIVSQILGHSSVKTTMDIYDHPTKEDKLAGINNLNFFS